VDATCVKAGCTSDDDCDVVFPAPTLTLSGVGSNDRPEPAFCGTAPISSNDALECIEQIEVVTGAHASRRRGGVPKRAQPCPRSPPATRLPAVLGDLEVPVLSRADFVANKRAVGRPKDLADVAWLEGQD
jgi:hypothetical protein